MGLDRKAASKVWREVSEACSEVFTPKSSRAPRSAQEVGLRTQGSGEPRWSGGRERGDRRPSQPRLT